MPSTLQYSGSVAVAAWKVVVKVVCARRSDASVLQSAADAARAEGAAANRTAAVAASAAQVGNWRVMEFPLKCAMERAVRMTRPDPERDQDASSRGGQRHGHCSARLYRRAPRRDQAARFLGR